MFAFGTLPAPKVQSTNRDKKKLNLELAGTLCFEISWSQNALLTASFSQKNCIPFETPLEAALAVAALSFLFLSPPSSSTTVGASYAGVVAAAEGASRRFSRRLQRTVIT
jgi:hypothetical protein